MFSSSMIPTTTILNVDDYQVGREAIGQILQQEGFVVIEAESGAEVLRKVIEAPPDLVLLDVKLPDISGYEVCRRMKQNPATAAIPVLMISGALDTVKDKALGLDSGADGYLTKPVETAELIATIKALLRMRQAEKQAQEARVEAETAQRLYRELVEGLDAIVWEADAVTWRFTYVSKRAEKMLGYPIERWLTEPDFWINILHPNDREYTVKICRRATDKARDHDVEYRVVTADGRTVWLRDIVYVTRDDLGEAKYLRGVMVDTTEQHLVEEALLESELLNRAILSSLPAHIAVLDRDGNIMTVNKAWELFNRENTQPNAGNLSATVGMNYLAVCESAGGEQRDGASEARAGIQSVLRRERDEFMMEYPCHSTDSRRWFLLNATPLPEEIGGAVVSHLDITERKLAEEQRSRLLEREQEAHARAEEVIRLKDEFLATASHELRAPLHAILGWTKLLRGKGLSPEEAERAIEIVERSAEAQSRIISDLLDVSRVITGKLRLSVRPFDPIPVVEAAVDIVRLAAEAKGVSIESAFAPSVGEIMGDPDRLQQIVWNLVSNAVKFTPQNGKVNVRLGLAGSNKGEIEIVVQDSGAGINPEFLPYVFDPFRQADGSRTRKYGGLGLGLAIVRRLAELHGGDVRAESEGENHGSTFTIRLPSISGTNRAENVIEAPSAAPSTINEHDLTIENITKLEGMRILVVDDEPDCAALTSYLLSQWGADVKTAISADEALDVFERYEEWSPDILVSDIQMPGVDGYTLMRRVREIESGRGGSVSAIALTAHTRAEDRIRALAAGFQIHVAKPVEPVELLTVVESLSNRPARHLHSNND